MFGTLGRSGGVAATPRPGRELLQNENHPSSEMSPARSELFLAKVS